MKNIIILLVLFSINAQAQSKRLIEVAREFTTKDIILSDGLVYKWRIGATNDTARYFNAGGDEYEVVATFKKVGGVEPDPDPVTETIDGFNMAYTGWSTNSTVDPVRTPGWHNNTISYSTTGEARYTFTGTGVELWGEKLPTHGTGTVTVGTETKTVSWVGPKELPAKIVEFKGLQRGEHTIIVKPVSGYVLIDYLIIQK